MFRILIFILLLISLAVTSCKVGEFRPGDYVKLEYERRCLCQINEVYPKRRKLDVVCNIGEETYIAKKSKAKIWYKCEPKEEFTIE